MLAWSEKRRSTRIAKQLDGSVERTAMVVPEGRNRNVPVLVFDVSREGLGFASLEPFAREAYGRIIVETAVSGGASLGLRRFMAPIVVRHCTPAGRRGYKVGVMLRKEGSPRDLTAWNELIQYWSGQIM